MSGSATCRRSARTEGVMKERFGSCQSRLCFDGGHGLCSRHYRCQMREI